jgi:hypothetical protein
MTQKVFNDCYKVFAGENLSDCINVYLVLQGARTMTLIEIPNKLLDTPVATSIRNSNNNEFVEIQGSVHHAMFVSDLYKLVRKYDGDITFMSGYVAVLCPNFNNMKCLLEAMNYEKTEKSIHAVAQLLGYPKISNFQQKPYAMDIILVFTTTSTPNLRVQLYGFKINSSKPINIDKTVLCYKEMLQDLTIKHDGKVWSLLNIEITLGQWQLNTDDIKLSTLSTSLLKTL